MTMVASEVDTWWRTGTTLFESRALALDEPGLRAPSALPGWTRAHVVAHLARNADALCNLLDWASTGKPAPMYPDPGARARGIEQGARQPAPRLRADLAAADARWQARYDAMPEAAWTAWVRSARGRRIRAGQVPWLRTREVWLHTVDLGVGVRIGEFPASLVDALLDDLTPDLGSRPGIPAVLLRPVDRVRRWSFGWIDASTVSVGGTAADLLGWISGRCDGQRLSVAGADALPELPPWL